uniref:CSON003114 protein n=1 Tax=Culicoides sonorensis TaxID=179676 RepID=A0A336LX97_CULSO
MKNCYIANCDKANNYNSNRSMFSVPCNEIAFQKWAAVIPVNKRPLQKQDRICDRHFREDEIEKYWEHNINGVITKMLKDRPKLKPDAVPSQNLVCESTKDEFKTRKKRKIKSKIEKKNVVDDIVILQNSDNENDEEIEIQIIAEDKFVIETPKKTDTDNVAMPMRFTEEEEKQRREDFVSVYEEVFGVQLPSQLWGIHRCPDMKFMAFTRFDAESLNACDKVVRISDLWYYIVYYKGVKVKEDYLSIMTDESVTGLLDDIDKMRYSLKDNKVLTKRKYVRQQLS